MIGDKSGPLLKSMDLGTKKNKTKQQQQKKQQKKQNKQKHIKVNMHIEEIGLLFVRIISYSLAAKRHDPFSRAAAQMGNVTSYNYLM